MHYLMLTDSHKEMSEINNAAAFILADGMPIVWRSRFTNKPIPERVAGSDLIYSIAEMAAEKGQSIYFWGGAAGVAQSAAEILKNRNPGLKVAGVESPPFGELGPDEEAAMIERIKSAKPDILLVVFGQPKGEAWIHRWHQQLGDP
ncbi:MAG: WecB/TagA/CpsF family glycosyltransferase [Fuerstiella sp.]